MLTVDQVVALAPDPASLQAGRALSSPSNWTSLGRDSVLMWGDCRGSGKSPYRIAIEHATTDYTCSCPSRKFPCKHVIGLLLLAAAGAVRQGTPPEHALAWFVARERKRKAKETNAVHVPASAAADESAREAAAQKRAKSRDGNVSAGLDEMERWLFDIARLGIASVQREPAAFWNAKAARLVDAQAPGLARRVRDLGEVAAGTRDVSSRMLASLGSLYALREAFARLEHLAPDRRTDVRRHLGFTQREDEAILRPGAIVEDRWTVVGTRSEEDERVVSHRAWLFGERSQRFALILQFIVPGSMTAPLSASAAAGAAFTGKIAYFEASVPQRAVVVERGAIERIGNPPGGDTIASVLDRYASDVGLDPWFVTTPVRLAIDRLAREGETWLAVDASRAAIPLTRTGHDPFVLQALCGDRPMTLFAEWNGAELLPLAVVADGRFVRLT